MKDTSRSSSNHPPRRISSMREQLRRLAARGRRSMARARRAVAILTAQQEATVDGVLVVTPEGHPLTFNSRLLEVWNVAPELGKALDRATLVEQARTLVRDWESFTRNVTAVLADPAAVRAKDELWLKDGRVLELSTAPITVRGRYEGRAWYFRDITEQKRAEKIESVVFTIARLSRESADLQSFYAAIHEQLAGVIVATNFFIAEYDEDAHTLHFPYFVDEFDTADDGADAGHGLTAYVIRTGEPLLAAPEVVDDLVHRREVDRVGVPSVDWLGVPLKTGDRVWGVIGTQTYDPAIRLTEKDKQVLVFVAQQVASAIEQRRKDDAVRESEQRYRQMFENNRAVQLLIEPASGAILDANVAACDYYGYTHAQLLRMRIWDINVLQPEAVLEEMRLAAAQARTYFNFRHRLASGEIRDVEVHSGPVEIGGRSILYSIIHDITERRRAERSVHESEEKFRNIFNYAPVGIYQSTRDGVVLTANLTLATMLGYDSAEELLGKNLGTDVYESLAERDRIIAAFEESGVTVHSEVLWRRRDGSRIWVQLSAHSIVSSDETILFEGFVFDVTERRAAQAKERMQTAAMNAAIDGVGILDSHCCFSYVNDALASLHGYPSATALHGMSLQELFGPREQSQLEEQILPAVRSAGRWRGETEGMRRDGTSFPEEISLTTIENGGLVFVVRDITERALAEEQIRHLAYHDALTGLPNRLLMKDRLTIALIKAQRENSSVAVLFLDLDRFKVINDTLGHNAGDQLLQAAALRIRSCVREADTVSRLGGDEFTVTIEALKSPEDAAMVAEKILESMRLPFSIEGREFFVTTSVGISIYPDDGGDADSLLRNADTAMYQAKEQGRDTYQLFNASVNAKALQRAALANGLRRALANNELSLHYQPIFDFGSNKATGAEALLRWNDPEHGQVPPGVFIPIAEQTGLMVAIGEWALRTACEQWCRWRNQGLGDLTLAINLSMSQLQHDGIVQQISKVLAETGVPPDHLEFEITETSAMSRPEASIRTVMELKKLGTRIALDDFGTGHSSLSYIKSFPIDTLKIDQSFVRDTDVDHDTTAIVEAIIGMAHSLRLRVVAEGVETLEQYVFLRDHGCDALQGFLITPPVPADEFPQTISIDSVVRY